jgi:imidazole glycerol-phosphate synthase subunit HisH
MVAIVDYGVGKLRSVQKAIEHSGHSAVATSDAREIRDAERVILPGVGAFGAAVQHLRGSGLDEVVLEVAEQGKPLLGICVGMQLLMDRSYEMGEWEGLGLIPGEVVRFDQENVKVPQIGWNSVVHDPGQPLLKDIPEELRFYFVHS